MSTVQTGKHVHVIGPSGVGKSTMLNAAQSAFPDAIFFDLDSITGIRAHKVGLISRPDVVELYKRIPDNNRFLDFGLEGLREIAEQEPATHIVVDLGARIPGSTKSPAPAPGLPVNSYQEPTTNCLPKMVFEDRFPRIAGYLLSAGVFQSSQGNLRFCSILAGQYGTIAA